MSERALPIVRAMPTAPTIFVHKADIGSPEMNVYLLKPQSPVTVRSVEVGARMPLIRGQRFFLSATTPEAVENASLFQDALNGNLELAPKRLEGDLDADGSDPLRAFYLLLMPPLGDVLEKGFDLPHPLYAYQSEGVAFLARRRHALLADDMGLGKTIQTIVAIRTLLGSGFVKRALVICPAGLKTNWKAEFELWAPEVAAQVVQGDSSQRQGQWMSPAHVFIANYELLRNDVILLSGRPFDLVVLDEAQRIKNAETTTSRAIKAIPRRASWCLTGTPIENRVADLVSIFQFVKTDLPMAEDSSADFIRRQMEPYFLRRRKADVLTDLPPKQEYTSWLELSDAQQEAYRVAAEEGTVFLRNLGETVTLQHVLALLTRLKQICNFEPETGESVKLDYLKDSLEVIEERGEKALVFSQYTQTLDFLAERLMPFHPLLYHGGLTRNQKDAVLAQFKSDPEPSALLISLQAGGVGLNLQEASYVYHFDRWWNPAVERQAEDRAYRMGQKREVMVTRLVVRQTIEERIHKVLEEKQALFNRFIEENGDEETPHGLQTLTDEEYFNLVGLDPALARVRRAGI